MNKLTKAEVRQELHAMLYGGKPITISAEAEIERSKWRGVGYTYPDGEMPGVWTP